ncbi:MAG: NB-ARC domain-containing protein [Bacteroidota bacterium]
MSDIQNVIIDYEGRKIPKQLGRFPVSPTIFLGRENHTQKIHEKLCQKNNNLLLLVNGQGGIGKTTMASQYYFEYANRYSHLIWLVAETSIQDAIMYLALSLDIRFENKMAKTQKIREIIRVISTLRRPVLIVIDNVNDLKDLAENYRLLRQFHNTHILLTSRIERYEDIPTHKINHLTKETANILFKHYYKKFKEEEQSLLDAILKAIDYNTLVIELLAKNLHEFNNKLCENYPLQKLLEDIQEKGVLAISKSTKVRSDYKLTPSTLEDIIRAMYDVSALSEDEKQILSVFGTLSNNVIPLNHLILFLPNIEMLDMVLIKLFQKGWIDSNRKFKKYKTNPIISEVVKQQNSKRLDADTNSLVICLSNMLRYQTGTGYIEGVFKEIKIIVTYTETCINNSNTFDYNKSLLFERLGNFYKAYGNLDKSLNFMKIYFRLKQLFLNEKPENKHFKNGLAIAYTKLGEIYKIQGYLDKSLTQLQNAVKLFKELTESFPDNSKFKNNLVISYTKIGEIYRVLGNIEKAQEFFESRLVFDKKRYNKNSKNLNIKKSLAISYEKLGSTYLTIGNQNMALSLFVERLKLAKELFQDHQGNVGLKYDLAISYEKLGEIIMSLGNYERALFFFENDFKLSQELYDSFPSHIGFKSGLAIVFQRLGEVHLFLGNLNKSLAFFEKGKTLFEELHKMNPSNLGFTNGLAASYSKLGTIYTKLKKINKAINYLEWDLSLTKKLVKNSPNHVDFRNSLAVTYIKLGSLYGNIPVKRDEGIDYLISAIEIYQKLLRKNPKHVKFQVNYKVTVARLRKIIET